MKAKFTQVLIFYVEPLQTSPNINIYCIYIYMYILYIFVELIFFTVFYSLQMYRSMLNQLSRVETFENPLRFYSNGIPLCKPLRTGAFALRGMHVTKTCKNNQKRAYQNHLGKLSWPVCLAFPIFFVCKQKTIRSVLDSS